MLQVPAYAEGDDQEDAVEQVSLQSPIPSALCVAQLTNACIPRFQVALGPVRLEKTGKNMFLCPACTYDTSLAEECEVKEVMKLLKGSPSAYICTQVWLHGETLSSNGLKRLKQGLSCACFVTSPSYFVGKEPKSLRFFMYQTIAVKLGEVTGSGWPVERVQLPRCVELEIERLYGDSVVGYQQA